MQSVKFKANGFASVPVMVFAALVGAGLLGAAILKDNSGLAGQNKANLLAQVSSGGEDSYIYSSSVWYTTADTCNGDINGRYTCGETENRQCYDVWDQYPYPSGPWGYRSYYNVTCNAPTAIPTIKVLSPNGGETFGIGKNYTINFEISDLNAPVGVYLTGFDEFGGTYIADTITSNAQKHDFSWTILSTVKPGKYLIRVVAYPEDKTKSFEDSSDAPFVIVESTVTPFIKILSPNGDEVWHPGETHRVKWDSGGVSTVYINIVDPSIAGSGSTNYITPDGKPVSASSGYYDWTIPPIHQLPPSGGSGGTNYRITVAAAGVEKELYDTSDAPFAIVAPAGKPKLIISVSAELKSQNIMAGTPQIEFARYILDATQSGEDLRMTSFPALYRVSGAGNYIDLFNCKLTLLKGGHKVLTTGENVVHPTGSGVSFKLDGSGYVISKGTSEDMSLTCDVKSGATGSYQWGLSSEASPTITGVTSGKTITTLTGITLNANPGQVMTTASEKVLPQLGCIASTSCVSQYCQYGGNLQTCAITNSDCSTSSYSIGSCNSAPAPTPLVCDATAQNILNSLGGCSQINASAYPNVYNSCCKAEASKENLLKLLDSALADGVIDANEKLSLLSALDKYLSGQ